MESQKQRNLYKYTLVGGAFNAYFFTTINGITYEIKFVPSTNLLAAHADLEADVFEMVI